jgi:hypothetical protein
MNSPFVIKVIFEEYYHRLCDVHIGKGLLNIGGIFLSLL